MCSSFYYFPSPKFPSFFSFCQFLRLQPHLLFLSTCLQITKPCSTTSDVVSSAFPTFPQTLSFYTLPILDDSFNVDEHNRQPISRLATSALHLDVFYPLRIPYNNNPTSPHSILCPSIYCLRSYPIAQINKSQLIKQ